MRSVDPSSDELGFSFCFGLVSLSISLGGMI